MDTATIQAWILYWVRSDVIIMQIAMVLGKANQACRYKSLFIREA